MVVFRGDPCGIICILITYSAVFYADYVVVRWIILTSFYDSLWGSLHAVLFNLVISLLAGAHLRAVLSDPGLIPIPGTRLDFSEYHDAAKERESENESWAANSKTGSVSEEGAEKRNFCSRCESFRPPRAHHCRICNRCIRRMDHHCPWINNCVGEWNQKYFIQFLIYVGILSMYAAGLVVFSWTGDCPHCPTDLLTKQSRILHSVILMLESLLFGMFVLAIMIDQLSAIFSDETAVEQVKKMGRYRPKKPKMTMLGEVCGRGGYGWTIVDLLIWILPCHNGPQNFEQPPNYHV